MIDVSIIIPCFNSQNLIESRVEEVEAVMSCTMRPWKVRPTEPWPIMSALRASKSSEYQLSVASRRFDIG